MKKLLPVVIGLSVVLSGCLLVGPKRGHDRQGVKSANCHPSEYWDGHQCRHKGKAKGHDKHKKHKKHR